MQGPLLDLFRSLLGEVGRAGPTDVMAKCPFHLKNGKKESSPSFAINTHNGLWFCHSCGASGNLISFLNKMGLPASEMGQYRDLIEEIKATQLTPLPKVGYWLAPFPEERTLPEEALGLFQKAPRQMLAWGFTMPTLYRANVGYDSKNLRITFPLRDYTGQLVGFSGRALFDETKPRYKVYDHNEYRKWGLPELPPPPKAQILWGYDEVVAVKLHKPKLPLILVEGFKARLWLLQHGYHSTVALLGSSMSEEQQHLIERIGGTVYVFLDNDPAGSKKFEIAARLDRSCEVRIPVYDTLQPDSLSKDQLYQTFINAPTVAAWRIHKQTQPYPFQNYKQHHDNPLRKTKPPYQP
jgi:DNA primase